MIALHPVQTGNRPSVEGMKTIGKAFMTNPSLTWLDLSGKPDNDDGDLQARNGPNTFRV